MRLLCQKMVLLVAVSTLACSDPSGPLGSRHFVLHDISGRPLPTYLAPTPGLTATVVSGAIVFSGTDHAAIAEQRINEDGTQSDFTIYYTYKITDENIEFEPVSRCPDLCVGPPVGVVTGSGISIDEAPWEPGFIVYNYARE